MPYWEARRIISGQDETLVASAYVRENSVLLIVANWSDARRTAKLSLDWPSLTAGGPMHSARILIGRKTPKLSGGRLTLDIPARSLRLVVLEK